MAVSLREVAERAGVARGTVSCVLNDRAAEVRISAETEERVRRIAEEMGYRPNRLAQGLGKGRTNVIGLMIPGLRNPFFVSLMETAEERALSAGFDVLPDSAFLLRSSFNVQSKLSGWPIDGMLIWVTPDRKLSDYLGSWTEGVPVVYLGYKRDDSADYVAIDREGGVRQVMLHLRDRGYRRIAYVYPWADLQPLNTRYAAYANVCLEMGLEPERIFLESLEPHNDRAMMTQAGLREAAVATGISVSKRVRADRPDAIFCHNDLVAVGLLHGLRRGGLRVPDDIGIVGFDGIDEGHYLDIPLTTVLSPVSGLIENSLEILTGRLDLSEAKAPEPKQIILPTTLRVGATT